VPSVADPDVLAYTRLAASIRRCTFADTPVPTNMAMATPIGQTHPSMALIQTYAVDASLSSVHRYR